MYCANHPKEETLVTCGRCEKPICPRCMVAGPVGMRCRECSRPSAHAALALEPKHYLRAGSAGLVVALALGWIPGLAPLFILPLVIYGYAVAEVCLRLAQRRRALGLALLAAGVALLGVLPWQAGPLLGLLQQFEPYVLGRAALAILGSALAAYAHVMYV
jgi:hypothetical protein